MKRKLPTILILLVMVLVGAMYWVDLTYYTDSAGFTVYGPLWARYVVLAFPVLMCLLGLRTVGPKSISALRVQSIPVGTVFLVSAAANILWGLSGILYAFTPVFSLYRLALGFGAIVLGVWLILAGIQMLTQNTPSPTKSAVWGVLAAVPLCMVAVHRVMVSPSSNYRTGPMVRALSAIMLFLWFGMLLRSLYIALPRKRVRWLYLLGVLTFLFTTCLELPLAIYYTIFAPAVQHNLFESITLATLGLAAGFVSVSLAGKGEEPRIPNDGQNLPEEGGQLDIMA